VVTELTNRPQEGLPFFTEVIKGVPQFVPIAQEKNLRLVRELTHPGIYSPMSPLEEVRIFDPAADGFKEV
jgi:hypothetical protein